MPISQLRNSIRRIFLEFHNSLLLKYLTLVTELDLAWEGRKCSFLTPDTNNLNETEGLHNNLWEYRWHWKWWWPFRYNTNGMIHERRNSDKLDLIKNLKLLQHDTQCQGIRRQPKVGKNICKKHIWQRILYKRCKNS